MCNCERDDKIFCQYCKEEILDETYLIHEEDVYHTDCYSQMNLYMDSFGDMVEYNEEC